MTPLLSSLFIAWVPLLEPMGVDEYWVLLLLPLVIGISVVYKAIRMENLTRLPRQAMYMSAQILVFLTAAAAILWGITAMV
jgi:hypothetical protein